MACSSVLTITTLYQIGRRKSEVAKGWQPANHPAAEWRLPDAPIPRPLRRRYCTTLAFALPPDDIEAREVGGGRATRQPGQIRKEAALTSAVRVARQPPTLLRIGRSCALTLRCERSEPRRVVASHRPSRLGR